MSGRSARRPADGQPEGQPPAKKALDINAIRAQVAAKKAAVEAQLAGARSGSGSASPAPAAPEASSSRSAPPPAAAPAPAGPAALPPRPVVTDDMRAKIAAAKARVEALQNKAAAAPAKAAPTPAPAAPANPYLGRSSSAAPARSAPAPAPARPPVSGIALHPLLMEGANAEVGQERNEKKAMANRYKTMAPKFSTVRANTAAAEEAHKTLLKNAPSAVATVITNPYAPTAGLPAGPGPATGPNAQGKEDAEDMAPAPRERRSRKMQFSAPGKYVKQGDQLRNEVKLEELKKRIAEQSRKAGLDSEFDVLHRSLRRQAPPTAEWWDEQILGEDRTYDDIVTASEEWVRDSEDSIITHLVQHPIPIVAPWDRKETARTLMLTKKEQKKMRRQRRQAELEEKRDKQRMGLLPPDPPKVRLANLMKVLTSDAVQDPTKVEAKVRREVEMRRIRHEDDNEARKLTPDQRATKDHERELAYEAKGVFATAYIVRYLVNGRHKFKVRETAKHDLLSGRCLFHRDFALIIVEGVGKKIKHFKQLMTHRIDWTEEARPLGRGSDDEDENNDEDRHKGIAMGAIVEDAPEDTQDAPVDMSQNKCDIVWEGVIPERVFKYFRANHIDTDSKGKDILTEKYEGLWDLAKKWSWDNDDL